MVESYSKELGREAYLCLYFQRRAEWKISDIVFNGFGINIRRWLRNPESSCSKLYKILLNPKKKCVKKLQEFECIANN
jgi:hypothetical protein